MAVKAKQSAESFVPKDRSAILRAQTEEDRHSQMKIFVEDLRSVARFAKR